MDKFFASLQSKDKPSDSGAPSNSGTSGKDGDSAKKALPKGVVLGPDGKPCRSCMSVRDWMALARAEGKARGKNPSSSSSSASASSAASIATIASSGTAASQATAPSSVSDYPADCPPDVDRLGNHTWTFLHALTASYPAQASNAQQADMRQFLSLFARLYPCWVCADDFQTWMRTPGNAPRVDGQESFGNWMCEAHNEVNRKLGKKEFDCRRWRERWVDGWRDGRCE